MAIPASRVASSIPSVLSAAGSGVDLIGLILSQNAAIPYGSVLPFTSAAAVGAFFGLTSIEYQMASVYFQGPNGATITPGTLYFAGYQTSAVGAWLRSASLASMSLTQLQALSGTLTVTINGTPATSSSINLSTATSFSNAATMIQAGFTSPNFAVTYDAQRAAFLFTSTTTGGTSTSTYASGTLAAGLLLTQATGAVLSQGGAGLTPATAMPLYQAASGGWAGFSTTWEPVLADKQAFSQWTSQQNDAYFFAGYDSDPNALVANSTATWAYSAEFAEQDGSICIFGNATHAAAVLSWAASLNFDQKNGRSTLKFQSFSGLTPYVTDGGKAAVLEANGYNYYGAFATSAQNFQFFSPGQVTGQWEWADSYVNQIKFNSDLQTSLITLETNVGSIPYNNDGTSLIHAALADPISSALNFGTIRTGVSLSQAQIQELANAIGIDVSQTIQSTGWYLDIKPATAAARAARTSPPMKLYYTDGGSVQSLNLGSVEVQ